MTRRKLNVILLVSVVLLTGGFVIGLLSPGIRRLRLERAALLERQREIAREQQAVGDVGALYASILALDRQMQGFEERLPANRRFGEFLSALSDQLRRVGVEEYTVQPREELTLDGARLPENLRAGRATLLLPVRVAFEGSFAQVFAFLKNVEDLPRLSHVESLRTAGVDGESGRVRADILFHTYYLPAQTAGAAVQ